MGLLSRIATGDVIDEDELAGLTTEELLAR
jgi:hypothetical protein